MTEERLKKLFIDFCYQVVNEDMEDQRGFKEPVSQTQIPIPTTVTNVNNTTDSKEVYVDEIKEIKFLNDMTWINVKRKNFKNKFLGKCIKYESKPFHHNKEAVVALGLISPNSKITNRGIETLLKDNVNYLTGKKIQYTLSDNNEYIGEIIGIVN